MLKSAFLLPNYPPVAEDLKGYLWGKYFITPQSWEKAQIDGQDIQALYFCANYQVAEDLIEAQIKQTLNFNQAFFYIFGEGAAMGLSGTDGGLVNNRHVAQYVFIQLAKYRSYLAYNNMHFNVLKLMELFRKTNSNYIKQIEQKSSHFAKFGIDNDFTECLVSKIEVKGWIQTPYNHC